MPPGNAGTTEEELSLDEILSCLDYKDSDKCLKDIILKIEEVHAQVQRLKTRADTVTSENPGKFSSVNKLSLQGPSVGLNIYERNPTSASARNKNTFPIRSGKTNFNMGDLLRHGSDVSSCVEMFPLIETNNNPQHEVLWEDVSFYTNLILFIYFGPVLLVIIFENSDLVYAVVLSDIGYPWSYPAMSFNGRLCEFWQNYKAWMKVVHKG